MKKIFVLISTLTIFVTSAFGQARDQDEIDRQIKAIMKAREELIRSLMDDNAFSNFDDRFNDLIKKFEQDSFGAMPGQHMGAVVGEYDWRETDTQQILVIKVKQIKDKPLDIKIEKGQVRMKGDVEEVLDNPSRQAKKISKIHFERSFSIPDGVDQTNPEFENKDGELLIKFKKFNPTKSSALKKSKQQHNQQKAAPGESDREPVGKDSEDPII